MKFHTVQCKLSAIHLHDIHLDVVFLISRQCPCLSRGPRDLGLQGQSDLADFVKEDVTGFRQQLFGFVDARGLHIDCGEKKMSAAVGQA